MTSCQRSAVARGYTSSVLGRRRLFNFSSPALRALRGSSDLAALPDMRGLGRLSNREDSEALRQAGNAPIQVRWAASSFCKLSAALAGGLLLQHVMLSPAQQGTVRVALAACLTA
jgi:DNA polymerase I-like protein with 3'-5' exonuclease and polymerase domains